MAAVRSAITRKRQTNKPDRVFPERLRLRRPLSPDHSSFRKTVARTKKITHFTLFANMVNDIPTTQTFYLRGVQVGVKPALIQRNTYIGAFITLASVIGLTEIKKKD